MQNNERIYLRMSKNCSNFAAVIKKVKILIADSDLSLATVLSDYLSSRGYDAEHETDGNELLSRLLAAHYDLLLMDIVLEGMNGFKLLKEIRRQKPLLPIIILTTKTDREAQLRAFELGCDDYQFKPFTMDILICRIEAILRRTRLQEESKLRVFQLGSVSFDSVHQTLGGQHLSGRLNDLLLLLCRRQDDIVDKHLILNELWQEDNAFTARSLHVFINTLRTMLAPHGYKILAVRNRGYKLVKDENSKI